ncbi:MAG: hypothetical protein AB7U05_17125 [Mangrovibacterium sp.]
MQQSAVIRCAGLPGKTGFGSETANGFAWFSWVNWPFPTGNFARWAYPPRLRPGAHPYRFRKTGSATHAAHRIQGQTPKIKHQLGDLHQVIAGALQNSSIYSPFRVEIS